MALYPDRPPFATRALDVGDGHRLHVDEWGTPGAEAALLLHGGPGSGCSPLLRRFFDPGRYHVVCVDQRGAGRSTPRGATDHNTTAHLLADLSLLRRTLGIARWLVVGGSWGATLALAHALAEPRAVSGLLLRALFLPRRQDIDAFFDGGPALPALAAGLADAQPERWALAWWRHECARGGTQATEPDAAAMAALVGRYRVQAHYLLHRCWLDEPPLLARCADLPPVPTLLLHAENDRVCPPAAARALQALRPGARLQVLPAGGHDPAHPAMVQAMVDALDRFAAAGDFGPPT